MTWEEVLITGSSVTLIGMGVVFVGLILLVAICSIMSALLRGKQAAKPADERAPVEAPVVRQPVPQAGQIGAEVKAVMAGCIALSAGMEAGGLRIHSITRLS